MVALSVLFSRATRGKGAHGKMSRVMRVRGGGIVGLLLAHAIFQASLRLTVVQTVPSVQASACERNCIDAIKFNHIARAQMVVLGS